MFAGDEVYNIIVYELEIFTETINQIAYDKVGRNPLQGKWKISGNSLKSLSGLNIDRSIFYVRGIEHIVSENGPSEEIVTFTSRRSNLSSNWCDKWVNHVENDPYWASVVGDSDEAFGKANIQRFELVEPILLNSQTQVFDQGRLDSLDGFVNTFFNEYKSVGLTDLNAQFALLGWRIQWFLPSLTSIERSLIRIVSLRYVCGSVSNVLRIGGKLTSGAPSEFKL